MANGIRNIISQVNQAIEGIFKGSKLYGMATLVERNGQSQPSVNEQPVSYDDSYALQMYHRVQGATITYRPGYGDTQTTVNTFQVSAVVFNNEQITKIKTDEIAMIMQSILSTLNITSVRILPTAIILNSQQVFATEYRGVPYALDEYKSLMQINYQVEMTFKGTCFDLCPEDYNQCTTN
jgi:hypothetical protein